MSHSLKIKDRHARRKLYQDNAPNPLVLRECPQKKIAFQTDATAKQKAAEAFKRDGVILTSYKCPHCRLFHLTSMKQRSQP